jgi:hypothetical protein
MHADKKRRRGRGSEGQIFLLFRDFVGDLERFPGSRRVPFWTFLFVFNHFLGSTYCILSLLIFRETVRPWSASAGLSHMVARGL